MNKEEKQLLLKDLSARLPYGVKIELMPVTIGKTLSISAPEDCQLPYAED